MPRRLLLRSLSLALAALIAPQAPALAAPQADTVLDEVVARLGELAPQFENGGLLAVTVIRLDRPEWASFRGQEQLKAASTLKVVWMAAALDVAGIDAVDQYASAVLYRSSNDSAGFVIDVAGGIDGVNDYSHRLGLTDTNAYEWNFPDDEHHIRRAAGFPGPLRGNNLTTTEDLAGFWAAVAYGYALDPEEAAVLRQWSMGPKSSREASRLISRLPSEVGEMTSFKAGWLEIGREYEIDDDEIGMGGEPPGTVLIFEGGAVAAGSGIVTTPGGESYAIAVAAYDGRTWSHMTGWVEFVSCVVYSVVAADPMACERAGDPAAVRDRRAVPSGSLEAVGVDVGSVTVQGWAADPDAWMLTTTVEITFDGVVIGRTAATPTAADPFTPRFSRVILYEGGTHQVCAVARNDGSGPDTELGCLEVSLES